MGSRPCENSTRGSVERIVDYPHGEFLHPAAEPAERAADRLPGCESRIVLPVPGVSSYRRPTSSSHRRCKTATRIRQIHGRSGRSRPQARAHYFAAGLAAVSRRCACCKHRERASDHGGTELVLAVRRPAVDRAGDEEIELRPISEDRPEAEGFALVEPIAPAKLLSIEAAEAKAEAARIIGGDIVKAGPSCLRPWRSSPRVALRERRASRRERESIGRDRAGSR